MKIGDRVQLSERYIQQIQYPYSELAKLRYFTVVSLPDEYGVVKLRRGDLASQGIEYHHESFLTVIE
uniref:Uncharacterized protein n=1 Tax=viral metagenome TaxID=1070528 RepID=A0A6H1ZR95_9ZZZZ